MKDQYGNPIPNDLTLLLLTPNGEKQLKAILNLNWYCLEGNKSRCIFVSYRELEKAIGDLSAAEIDIEDAYNKPYDLALIDSVLKRYNETDGWYWA